MRPGQLLNISVAVDSRPAPVAAPPHPRVMTVMPCTLLICAGLVHFPSFAHMDSHLVDFVPTLPLCTAECCVQRCSRTITGT